MLLDIKSFFDNVSAEIVYIPEIQRDYAQGRDSAKSVRDVLLGEIFDKALAGTSDVVLNYIYGVPKEQEIIENGTKTTKKAIVLIDGQQRLTTLFLLEYYLSAKLRKDSQIGRLKYATRETSMSFCDFLSNKRTTIIDPGNGSLSPSSVLENEPDFRKKWLYDPTVSGMLNMLDAIAERVEKASKDVKELYENLSKVKFSFISLDGFKRTEELYSAMNSRGKKLTKFEIHKGILLKVVNYDNELPGDINDNWVPAFWNLAVEYAKANGDKNPEKFAAEQHDRYLYNYFSFIVRMLWWERSNEAKEITKKTVGAIPDLEKIIEKIFNANEDTGSANLKLLKFAMDKDFIDNFRKYEFKEKFSQDEDFECYGSGSRQEDFFKRCCQDDELDNVIACYLWAYVKYWWDVKERSDCRLIDYLLVMRALVMSKIRGTVTGKDSPDFEKFMYNDVLKNFKKIVDGEKYQQSEQYYGQYLAFVAENERKYSILNNKFIRGSVGNIVPVLESNEETEWFIFDENMKWIQENAEKENGYGIVFRRFASCDLEHIDMRCNDATKVFLPATGKILNSIFSHLSWSETDDYCSLLSFLCTKKLDEIKDKNFEYSDWCYYVWKYETFRDNTFFAQYVSDIDLQETDEPDFRMCLNAKYIDGVNATERQKRNPFVYELCCKAEKMLRERVSGKSVENVLKELRVKPFEVFKDRYGITFREENKDFIWTYTEQERKKEYHCSGEKDIIEEFFDECFSKVIDEALQEYLNRSTDEEDLQR